jgi:hypothetical protein
VSGSKDFIFEEERNKVHTLTDERFLVSPFFVLFLIYSNIIGVGIMGFQRDIIKSAGYDAWISVLLSSISIHVLVWMTYLFLQLLRTVSFISINFALGNGLAGY